MPCLRKEVLRDHQASCDGMKPMPYEPDTDASYEKTKFNVLSLYGDLLGVEQNTESFSYGRPACDDFSGLFFVSPG